MLLRRILVKGACGPIYGLGNRIQTMKALNRRMTTSYTVRHLLKRLKHMYCWQRGVKALHGWLGPFINIGALLGGGMTASRAGGIVSLVTDIGKLVKHQGPKGAAQYLKACHIFTMKYVASDPIVDSMAFGPVIGRTLSGIPKIVPPLMRKRLREREVFTIRMLLTVFGLYRVLDFKGTLKVETITAPWSGRISPDLRHFSKTFLKD